jgi:glycosyltransferase involved in cell wall biosynthesis
MSLVSVVVPVYNTEKYLRACLDSVINQTFQDFELIIVNDESPDNSLDIIQDYYNKYPDKVVVIVQNNRGLAGARNSGIDSANSKYIAFLDSDDLWLPEKLEKHVSHLESNPSVGISYSWSQFINEEGELLNAYITSKTKNVTVSDLLCKNPLGNGSTPIIRREIFEQAGVFDESLRQSEDLECWVRIASTTNWSFEGIPEVLTLYRINNQSLSANVIKQHQSWLKAVTSIGKYNLPLLLENYSLAKAYEHRYLARQAIRVNNPKLALMFLINGLKSNWGIIKDFKTTVFTAAAVVLSNLVNKDTYKKLEKHLSKITALLHNIKVKSN